MGIRGKLERRHKSVDAIEVKGKMFSSLSSAYEATFELKENAADPARKAVIRVAVPRAKADAQG
jgi:hypothetical protein